MNKLTYFLGLLLFISGCKTPIENEKKNLEDESIFPKVVNVNKLNQTDFVPTLETTFDSKNNMIYCATLLFAWNEIRDEIGKPLREFSSKELEKFNNTQSFLNVLKDTEYETSVEVNGFEIRAKAYFRKSLPFEEPLIKFDEGLKFGDSSVESFGFWGGRSFAKINYFKNENEFSVSLFPKDQEHEIILIMDSTLKPNSKGFGDYFNTYKEQMNLKSNEPVYFNDEDKVEIPIIAFNLEKDFGQFVGSTFVADPVIYEVIKAYQRNAFMLNENGAEVESEAVMEVADAAEEEEFEKPKPKMMIFNQPFVVLLKRKDTENPYFGVYIANDELLKKK